MNGKPQTIPVEKLGAGKKIWKSKTVWVALVALVLALVNFFTPVALPVDIANQGLSEALVADLNDQINRVDWSKILAILTPLLMFILRIVTKEKVNL